jgi:hypothetical protein
MLYADIYNWLGWPDPDQAFDPSGAGAKVYAEFARKKLAGALSQAHPGVEIRIGVIAADPNSVLRLRWRWCVNSHGQPAMKCWI